jgi:hypothetical protein
MLDQRHAGIAGRLVADIAHAVAPVGVRRARAAHGVAHGTVETSEP